ncbi:MAG TPA: GTP cyclohydrolase II [Saprospiraceae bacterium]|nr:GTP cyclohydrolase II [Saprospiraceae bacterium]
MNKQRNILKRQAEALIPTPWGNFNMIAFSSDEQDWMPHLALVHEDFTTDHPTLVRVHSECITGDLFGSKRCDCGEQLHTALKETAATGGVVLYLRQEGRGIGIINKLKAYQLQDLGLNTIDANVHLGLEIDARQYDVAIAMLKELDIKKIRLLTNNPDKVEALEQSNIEIIERVPLIITPKKENLGYLKTKQEKMGHLFRF